MSSGDNAFLDVLGGGSGSAGGGSGSAGLAGVVAAAAGPFDLKNFLGVSAVRTILGFRTILTDLLPASGSSIKSSILTSSRFLGWPTRRGFSFGESVSSVE